VSSTADNVVTSQLLVEMPAQSAARLLTLSLLEQLPQYAAALTAADPRQASRHVAAYRSIVRRLRSSMALYDDALGNGVPRKARRRLRTLSDAAERLYRADVQLAWCARHAPEPGHVAAVGVSGDGARASIWLCDRVARRRERALRVLLRVQSDARPLRRIAKRLGVYTTAVRLDTVTTQHSFARLTSDRLTAVAATLGTAMQAVRADGSEVAVRRALRFTERLAYLLDPLRAYADVEEPIARLNQLRGPLEHLDHATIVARAIVRGGRRVAAAHAGDVLSSVIWPKPDASPAPAIASTNGHAPVAPGDVHRGLLVLAETLHDEVASALLEVEASWSPSAIDELANEIGAIATRLRSGSR
jgi:hypothetical protein